MFQEVALPEPPARPAGVRGPDPVGKIYLIVRQDHDREDNEGFTASLLTRGATAAIESGRMPVQAARTASTRIWRNWKASRT